VFAFDMQTAKPPLWHSLADYQLLAGSGVTDGLIMAQSVIPGQDQQEKFLAFDSKNGSVRWQITLANLPCDVDEVCSPHQVQIVGQRFYALDYSHLQVFEC
jgi:hypothetical protein